MSGLPSEEYVFLTYNDPYGYAPTQYETLKNGVYTPCQWGDIEAQPERFRGMFTYTWSYKKIWQFTKEKSAIFGWNNKIWLCHNAKYYELNPNTIVFQNFLIWKRVLIVEFDEIGRLKVVERIKCVTPPWRYLLIDPQVIGSIEPLFHLLERIAKNYENCVKGMHSGVNYVKVMQEAKAAHKPLEIRDTPIFKMALAVMLVLVLLLFLVTHL